MDDISAIPSWNNGYDEFWNQELVIGNDHQLSNLLPFAMAPPFPDFSNYNINHFANPPQNQNNKTTMFFKTRLCTKFKLGSCPYGNNCNFAHGSQELRQPPPNWQEIVARDSSEQHKMNRNKICRSFYNGEECPYGNTCTFLHERRESSVVDVEINPVRQTSRSDSVVLAGGSGGRAEQNGGWVEQIKKFEMWKTKMCHKWEATGHCHFGENCSYAHGIEELKKFGSSGNTIASATTKPNVDASTDQVPMRQSNPKRNIINEPQMKDTKIYERLKKLRKINGIYGDWI